MVLKTDEEGGVRYVFLLCGREEIGCHCRYCVGDLVTIGICLIYDSRRGIEMEKI